MPAAGQKKGDDGMYYYPELTKSPSPSKRRKRSDTPPPHAAADVAAAGAGGDAAPARAHGRAARRERRALCKLKRVWTLRFWIRWGPWLFMLVTAGSYFSGTAHMLCV